MPTYSSRARSPQQNAPSKRSPVDQRHAPTGHTTHRGEPTTDHDAISALRYRYKYGEHIDIQERSVQRAVRVKSGDTPPWLQSDVEELATDNDLAITAHEQGADLAKVPRVLERAVLLAIGVDAHDGAPTDDHLAIALYRKRIHLSRNPTRVEVFEISGTAGASRGSQTRHSGDDGDAPDTGEGSRTFDTQPQQENIFAVWVRY
jgi:hypothetical protein